MDTDKNKAVAANNSNSNLSIKDMLKSGLTEKALLDMLKDQIASAQKEITREQEEAKKKQEKEDKLAEARRNLVLASIDYYTKLNLLDENTPMDEEDIDFLIDQLQTFEQELDKTRDSFTSLLHMLKPAGEAIIREKKKGLDGLDFDSIIEEFIKSLE